MKLPIAMVDVEASGLNFGSRFNPLDSPKPSQPFDFSIMLIHPKTLEPLGKPIHQKCQFDHNRFHWSNDAERVHGISQECLSQQPTMAEAGQMVFTSMKEVLGLTKDQPLEFQICSANILDSEWLNFWFACAKKHAHFLGVKCYDYKIFYRFHDLTAILAESIIAKDGCLASSNNWFKFLGITRSEKHNSMEDMLVAWTMLKLVRYARNRRSLTGFEIYKKSQVVELKEYLEKYTV